MEYLEDDFEEIQSTRFKVAIAFAEEWAKQKSANYSASVKARWEDPEQRFNYIIGFLLSPTHASSATANLRRWAIECPEEFVDHYAKQGARLIEQMRDPERRTKAQQRAQITYDTPEYHVKRSKLTQQQYIDNPALKEVLSKAQAELWSDAEYREKQIQSSKDVWDRPGYRERQIETFKIIRNTPEYHVKRSKLSQQQYIDHPQLREDQSKRAQKWWDDPENYAQACARQKEIQNRPENRNRARRDMTALMNSPQGKKIVAKSKATRSTPEYKEKNCARRKRLLADNKEYRQVTIDNINAGREKMMQNAAARHEELLLKFLSLFSQEGLRQKDILRLMKDKFNVYEDVCVKIRGLALDRDLVFKAPGKMGAYFLTAWL